ncbi:MAG: polyisoprenoid-binding protein [Alphaproteobacteria bacterium RIFCSPHIGHO2_12_FULL_45_9]|nr:MAG: polyisoprenoid-binding protein [Alphaproteobacteria bacterium RIFCSPHIGHO2_02_FULL_46_13]OFW98395.1 MAG: polyisoprenoid-binding protein [Alphaproteobacteria bacterium RIFCSPHIGHO2_12_FULL_45_9]
MIRTTLRTLALTAMVSTLAFSAQAAETYKLDASHTAITWHVNHFGFSTPSGKFMSVDGEVTLDEANPAASSVKVTVDVAGINSGVPKLDEHLKTPDFFDVAKFPTATFVSKKVELTGKDTAKVEGDLTLRGVTKPVVLDVKLNKIGENMFKLKTAGFTASTTIKRSEFGMTTYVPNLGDDVKIDIESEANILPKQ